MDGVEYPSVEIAYQAAKWKPEDRDFFKTCTSRESIVFNHENNPNLYGAEAWDKIRVSIMRDLLKQKFDRKINSELADKLKETGDKHLEEMNWWSDLLWVSFATVLQLTVTWMNN